MTVTEIAAVHDENKSTVSRSVNRAKKTLQDLAKSAAADLIENQQRHIEALMKANDSLKDAIARRDKQIEDMKQLAAELNHAAECVAEGYVTWVGVRRMLKECNVEVELI